MGSRAFGSNGDTISVSFEDFPLKPHKHTHQSFSQREKWSWHRNSHVWPKSKVNFAFSVGLTWMTNILTRTPCLHTPSLYFLFISPFVYFVINFKPSLMQWFVSFHQISFFFMHKHIHSTLSLSFFDPTENQTLNVKIFCWSLFTRLWIVAYALLDCFIEIEYRLLSGRHFTIVNRRQLIDSASTA